jgi:predicted transport protein
LDTVEVVPLRIELYRYINYENDIFLLEALNVVENKPVKEVVSTPTEVSAPGENTVESLLQSIPNNMVNLFQEMRQRIFALDDSIVEKPTRYYVAYRVTKNFAEVIFAKNHIKIHMRPVEYDDPRNMVDKIPDSYNWALNRRVYLKKEDDLDYVMSLIEQAYKDVL